MVIEYAPLEDELGDILDKGMRLRGISEAELARESGVAGERIRDAIDYRYDLSDSEILSLASALRLNGKGLVAVARGTYPAARIGGLPLCLYPLRFSHGIGVANAYIAADCSEPSGILFDCGADAAALLRVWPKRITRLDAIFLTHAESEHCGGLVELARRFAPVPVFGPSSVRAPGVSPARLEDGAQIRFGRFQVTVMSTPGHSECHHCYCVSDPSVPGSSQLLVSGDLLFAGSVGAAHFCANRLLLNAEKLLRDLPEKTVVAPGHGPLTTIAIERQLNPFSVSSVETPIR
ncbi:MAG: MBL fold metallo-hydrolase [Opitutaceae bacterium]|nr:MBL fold metallo-hydrolase [Opitutaceae bacterium]